MIVVPESFREMPRWWADAAGRAWLDTLPQCVEDRCRRWRLSIDGGVMHGSNALVVPVRRGDAELVLRLAPPGDDVLPEAAALRMWDGRGTVLLYDVDVDDRAMLLERLDGGRSLAREPLEEATRLLAGLTTRLAVPITARVLGTDQVAAAHAEEFERDWFELGEPFPRTQLDAAIYASIERSEAAPAPFAANGDLHFEQVLAGTREPWLVVDPVLLRGDPEYDLGRVLWSRLDEARDDAHVRALFDLFVETADVPPERARAWVLIRSTSYLLWGLDRGLTEDPPRCRRLIDIFA